MSDATETLFLPLTSGILEYPGRQACFFLNAQAHAALKNCGKEVYLQQFFKPAADVLEKSGSGVHTDFPDGAVDYAAGLLLFPKGMAEGEYMLARACAILQPGGLMIIAADNKAGGGRLKKTIERFGFENIGMLSKHKARVVWGIYKGADQKLLASALEKGTQHTSVHGFRTQAGIFGWDKIDAGSRLLAAHLPALKGTGADFGCGYGYLARQILEKPQNIKRLYCIDADARAVAAAQENLKSFGELVDYQWRDLTVSQDLPQRLDWIVMNPPFHAGDKADSGVGKAFIVTASTCLSKGGRLWMAANAHLPYEQILREKFSSVIKIHEGDGFKIYEAAK